MSEYPRRNANGETVWACCESKIGPDCQHKVAVTPRELAEGMVSILRKLRRHRDSSLRHDVFGKQAEAFYALLATEGWPKGMARDALDYVIEHPECTVQEAMFQHQTG